MSGLGLVVSRHRRHVIVEAGNGQTRTCHSASRSIHPLVGDRVQWTAESDTTGIVAAIEPRSTLLTRVDSRGRGQPVAANLTQLVVVIAAEPEVDWLVLDHYLVAAELARVTPLIVFNKTDIRPPPPDLDTYRSITTVLATSARENTPQPELLAKLAGERSALVGQSGVGKSSLLNVLCGEALQPVGELSEKIRQGRHTTTGSALYRLDNEGELIDSPGVRRYAPFIEHENQVAGGFPEFHPLTGQCRFADCRHMAEPGCAVKAALDGGNIAQRRYDNYCNLHALVAELRARREAGG